MSAIDFGLDVDVTETRMAIIVLSSNLMVNCFLMPKKEGTPGRFRKEQGKY